MPKFVVFRATDSNGSIHVNPKLVVAVQRSPSGGSSILFGASSVSVAESVEAVLSMLSSKGAPPSA